MTRLSMAAITAIMAGKMYFLIGSSSVFVRRSIGFRRGERCAVSGSQPLQRLLAEHQKQDRSHDRIEDRGTEQTAEDRHGNGVQDFPARLVRADQERGERQSCTKRR